MRATTAAMVALAAVSSSLLVTMTTAAVEEPTTKPVAMMGGWSAVAVSADNTQTLLDALSGGDAGYDDEAKAVDGKRVCFTAVKKVEQQVVAGTNYRFYIEGCKVATSKLAGECGAQKANKCDKPTQYVVQVFEQVWTDTLQVKSIKEEAGTGSDGKKTANAEVETVSVSVKVSADDTEYDEKTDGTAMSDEEKRQVDKWISANDLNQYGDSKHTMYTGGTPLFNERTGEYIDRYDYILSRHPDRPWETQGGVLRANLLAVSDESVKKSDGGDVNTKGAVRGSAHGLMTIIVSVGVLTVVIALVAGVKAKRTRHRFAYDSLRNREY